MRLIMKTWCAAALMAMSVSAAEAQIPVKVETFPVSSVRLTKSAFKHAEDLDIRYLLGIDPDRLLAPYLKGAGLTPKAENYPNWENTGLDGHIGGHYLSALSYMYAATGNTEIKARLDYMLSEMKRCQDAAGDGYLCGVPGGRKMWAEIKDGNIRANSFGLNDRWVPLYNIHKTYAGLRDAYLVAGCEEARDMFVKLADWMADLTNGLTEEQMQQFVDLYSKVKFNRTREIMDMFLFSFHACGLRVSDIVTLEWSHIDWDRQELSKNLVKGKVPHTIPLTDAALEILKQWQEKSLNRRFVFNLLDSTFDTSDAALLDKKIKSKNRILQTSLNEVGNKMGLPFHLSMHVARHTFAVMALNRGVTIHMISRLLGHSSILTTEKVYAEFLPDTITEEVKNKLSFGYMPSF